MKTLLMILFHLIGSCFFQQTPGRLLRRVDRQVQNEKIIKIWAKISAVMTYQQKGLFISLCQVRKGSKFHCGVFLYVHTVL